MALIKCPECNNMISDKSKNCVHCGFPLSESVILRSPNTCLINGTVFDLSEVLEAANLPEHNIDNKSKVVRSEIVGDIMNLIQEITHIHNLAAAELALQICTTKSIPDTFDPNQYKRKEYRFATVPIEKMLQPKCPKCGSTAIATGARGINWTLGPIGASKTVNRCGNCGYTFTPKG